MSDLALEAGPDLGAGEGGGGAAGVDGGRVGKIEVCGHFGGVRGVYISGLRGSWSAGIEVFGLDLCWIADGGADCGAETVMLFCLMENLFGEIEMDTYTK